MHDGRPSEEAHEQRGAQGDPGENGEHQTCVLLPERGRLRFMRRISLDARLVAGLSNRTRDPVEREHRRIVTHLHAPRREGHLRAAHPRERRYGALHLAHAIGAVHAANLQHPRLDRRAWLFDTVAQIRDGARDLGVGGAARIVLHRQPRGREGELRVLYPWNGEHRALHLLRAIGAIQTAKDQRVVAAMLGHLRAGQLGGLFDALRGDRRPLVGDHELAG